MRKSFLIILDGWGIGSRPEDDAIAKANTPYFDSLIEKYPSATLTTFGTQVGLPEGQMGNSEVGHLNIGAGRVVYQELLRINNAIEDTSFFQNSVLQEAIKKSVEGNKKIHFLGLFSDGGVHSHIKHLKALVEMAESLGAKNNFVHAFTDGRDVDPKSGYGYLIDFEKFLEGKSTKVATITGRYYAMDRDNRWERIKIAYDALVKGQGTLVENLPEAIQRSYLDGITDEFILPIVKSNTNKTPLTTIDSGDTVIFFNFRTDRPRQLTLALSQVDLPDFDMHKLNLNFISMVNYDSMFQGIDTIFEKDNLDDTIGEVLSKNGKTQLRIAETEKYPHVTFFFNGGREVPFVGESRILINSPKVATYDLQPEMSAFDITNALLEDMNTNHPDFIALNFANTDMVGHTGDFTAAVKAAETVDNCLETIVPEALKSDYGIIIIADHGNSDVMRNADGSPNTAHTTNPVPVIYVAGDAINKTIRNGKLADIAPTLLSIMGIEKSPLMTGESLLENKM